MGREWTETGMEGVDERSTGREQCVEGRREWRRESGGGSGRRSEWRKEEVEEGWRGGREEVEGVSEGYEEGVEGGNVG